MSQHEIEKSGSSQSRRSYFDDPDINGPVVTPCCNLTLHERFSEKAAKFPDTHAIISDDGNYTYEQVEKLSNALARKISELTDGKSSFVGISMERSALVVMGILSIIKAGSAYVPLDPSYPKERLHDMLADTKAPIVITTSNLKPVFADHDVLILCLDDCPDLIHEERSFRKDYDPESLAYVIFTSGSTGKPKGVCCFHKSVLNLLCDFQNRQPIGHGDICSWWTSLNFDVSVYEIFSPLIEGATLIVAPESVRANGPELMAWLYENNVTSAYLPPFMVSDLDFWTATNPGKGILRRLLVGVEPIPERTLLNIDRAIPSVHVINGYGPTETTICSTLYSVTPANPVHDNTPIGKPVQNTVIRILDEEGNLSLRGEAGELFIGGVGLAKGYLDRPELTQARFVSDRFSDDPGARLYKTGDLVRLLDDGNLEFLGRKDFQVKLRGFRVELGEIETLLRGLKQIREAVVLLREDEPGRQNLVAYFVFRKGESLSIRSIRDHLRKYLPDYMIPSAFVEIGTIPYTTNGKTDRNALPVP
ncbi:MAG: amino acid adenylation domain-containing protein, partial [Syntrophaceae bacterium]|nr:amino acid adenylation domain-containing protein [Syntrophaceae bacterium]